MLALAKAVVVRQASVNALSREISRPAIVVLTAHSSTQELLELVALRTSQYKVKSSQPVVSQEAHRPRLHLAKQLTLVLCATPLKQRTSRLLTLRDYVLTLLTVVRTLQTKSTLLFGQLLRLEIYGAISLSLHDFPTLPRFTLMGQNLEQVARRNFLRLFWIPLRHMGTNLSILPFQKRVLLKR